MNLELDHFFILVEPEAKVAELLVSLGIREGKPNRHEGQGTSNRRFFFTNGMLELIWVRDAQEAINGPGRELRFPERATEPTASPFGVILRRQDNSSLAMPFEGWTYQPVYFAPPQAFHVGSNSDNLMEPLCFYVPWLEPKSSPSKTEAGIFKSITKVKLHTSSVPISEVLRVANTAERLSIDSGNEHLVEVVFDGHQCGCSKDFRPDIPLIVHW